MDITRRSLIGSGAAGAALLAMPGAMQSAEAAPRVGKVLARGLVVPWGLAFLPNGDALVAERIPGRIQRIRRTGGKRLVGTVEGAADRGEGGLLGLAVSPTFRRDRWVYAFYTTESDNRIVWMRYRNGQLGRQHVLLAGIPADGNHNGGRLAFGPGGLLYATTGDADSSPRSQDLGSLAGKILRLRPDGGVPPGNPFGNYVWSYGHRNPQGLAWDRQGRLWAAELGAGRRDELNIIRRGRNYGWPNVEGGDGRGPYADPFVTWHPDNCSPSGIAVAGGRAWVAGLKGESLWSVRLRGPRARRKVRHFHNRFGRIRTVAKAPDGSLWITTSNRDFRGDPIATDDRVIRIRI